MYFLFKNNKSVFGAQPQQTQSTGIFGSMAQPSITTTGGLFGSSNLASTVYLKISL
jgi:hypothetical protein